MTRLQQQHANDANDAKFFSTGARRGSRDFLHFPFCKQTSILSFELTGEQGKRVHELSPGFPVMTEADTCRKYVVPKLQAAGWEVEAHSPGSVQQEGAEKAEIFSGTHCGRADCLKRECADFFERFSPEARAVLSDLLDKYTEHGATQFQFPDALKIPPVSNRGSVMEIAGYFGGPEELRFAVNQLQKILYAA